MLLHYYIIMSNKTICLLLNVQNQVREEVVFLFNIFPNILKIMVIK